MKKLIFLSIFLLFSLFSTAQPIEFKTEAYAISLYNNVNESFDDWDEWELTEVSVILDLDSGTLVIHSLYKQEYDLLNASFSAEKGRRHLTFEAVNNFEQLCLLRLSYLEEDDRHHLYIVWRQLRIVYQMKKL